MSAADKRVAELLERWVASVELHARYLALDDAAYARAQDWPRHQRPTRWVVDLARTRLVELERIIAERRSRGDAGFAEALELMAFLTTLLGSEHVERFIPLAQPPTGGQPAPAAPRSAAAAAVEPTVEARTLRPAAAAKAARRAEPARGEARQAPVARAGRAAGPAAKRPAAATPRRAPAGEEPPAAGRDVVALVVADAARLMSWGREWPQLAGLIARLANRPSEPEVWKILRAHRAQIEARARQPRD
jgi:hypothetical protein